MRNCKFFVLKNDEVVTKITDKFHETRASN